MEACSLRSRRKACQGSKPLKALKQHSPRLTCGRCLVTIWSTSGSTRGCIVSILTSLSKGGSTCSRPLSWQVPGSRTAQANMRLLILSCSCSAQTAGPSPADILGRLLGFVACRYLVSQHPLIELGAEAC